MTTDLFQSRLSLELIPIQGGDVSLMLNLLNAEWANDVLQELIQVTPWRAEEIVIWGKRHLQPRLIAWYGDSGKTYTYSGIRMQPLPWTHLLLQLKSKVEAVCNETFNSVLLNYYRNEQDSMGMHSDDEPELGPHPIIASLSLGEKRTFVFKPKHSKKTKSIRLALPSGSLLLMKGETQRNWQHGIAKGHRAMGPRINLTFRRIEHY